MSAPEPLVVLLATIEHRALPAGFCGRCFGVGKERRSRMHLYADVRPAALARPAQQAATSALLCQHFAHKQARGEFVCASATVLCPGCLEGDLRALGLPEDPIGALAGRPPAEQAPEEAEDALEEGGRYGLFVHMPEGPEGRAVVALVELPADLDLATALLEEHEVGVPPRPAPQPPHDGGEEER